MLDARRLQSLRHFTEPRVDRLGIFALRDRVERRVEQTLQTLKSVGKSEREDRIGTSVHLVLTCRFAHPAHLKRVMKVVGHLIRLADEDPKLSPSLLALPGDDGTAARRCLEQRTRLRAVVTGQGDGGLALPRLSADDPASRAHCFRDAAQEGGEVCGAYAPVGEDLERADDERVASEHGERLAEGYVNRGLPASFRGVVEARQVIVHQGRAVKELDGAGGRARSHFRAAAGLTHGVTKEGSEPGSPSEARVTHGRAEARRHTRAARNQLQVVSQPGFQE